MATPCLGIVRFPAQQGKAQGPKLLGSIKSGGYVQGCGGPTTLLHVGPTCPSLLRLENSPHPRAQRPPPPHHHHTLGATAPAGVMPLPATPAHGAVHLPRHTGVSMDTSAEAISVIPSPPVTADIEESLRDYTSMMERWTEEHVLGARVLRSKVAPNRVEAMRLEIAAGSAEITCFLDAFDECMKPVDLHLVTQKNSLKNFLVVLYSKQFQGVRDNAPSPRKLRKACFCQKTWRPKEGARVGDVIEMMQRLGGSRLFTEQDASVVEPVMFWITTRPLDRNHSELKEVYTITVVTATSGIHRAECLDLCC
uniref:Uncharacterized protein n=1 Tax=Oryza punctata TaxID=4537 RepID=A0A0E0MBK1_ORYPU